MEATREQLAAAFTEWMRQYEQEPEKFAAEYGPATEYGPAAADYLIKLLGE